MALRNLELDGGTIYGHLAGIQIQSGHMHKPNRHVGILIPP
jgi:hypothetical protein